MKTTFTIRCENCGAEQRWGEGVVLGEGTKIEVATHSIFCECGNVVEEADGALVESQTNIEPS